MLRSLLHYSPQISRAKWDLEAEMTHRDLERHDRKDLFLLPSKGRVIVLLSNIASYSLWPWATVLVAFPPTLYSPKYSCVWSFIQPLQLFETAWKKNISELHWNWDGNYTVNSWREAVWCWNGNIRFVLILYLK